MESYDKNFYEYGLAGQERNHAMDFVNSELDSLLGSPREEYKKILEETNEKAAECDALE